MPESIERTQHLIQAADWWFAFYYMQEGATPGVFDEPVAFDDIWLTARSQGTLTPYTLLLSETSGNCVVDRVTGLVRFSMDAAETAALSWRKGTYDIWASFAGGARKRLWTGPWLVAHSTLGVAQQ